MTRLRPLALIAMLFASPLIAQQSPVVVELFTSQGCSSCPPADALLHEIADREDVIALALHVDYWDYIGWKDPFGSPAHAERQRDYARVAKRRMIYTPEMIVQGHTDIVGAKPMALLEAIAAHAARAPQVALEVTREGGDVVVGAELLAAQAGPMTVHFVRYAPNRKTHIKRGENAGRTLSYANVVENWQTVARWDGRAPLVLRLDGAAGGPAVVIVQRGVAGPVLSAANVP